MSVRPFFKISVTYEPIEFYSLGKIFIVPVVVLGYFMGGWDTLPPPKKKNKKSPLNFKKIIWN